ncbi:MAG: Amuc_1100 family pilus-like protein [Kiritimatiellae bacterium]|nr:Amuc_1100 family pilus-like protein [Kiritimatiellia bacterium]
MNKNRVILAAAGGVIALAVLVMAFLTWLAYAAKVAAQEGDDEEGTDGLETVVSRAQSLSGKPIYPCAESVKALKADAETLSAWQAEALKFASRGDRPIEKTTPPAFKAFIVADAKRIASLRGSVNGALVKPDFAFGPFKDYVIEGKMPPEANLVEIQRRWDDVATIAETLAACGVNELVDVAFRDDAAAKEAAEKENAKKDRRGGRAGKKGAEKEPAVRPAAYGYTFTFLARPPALVKVLNALTTCERFTVICGLTFDRSRDVIKDALGGDEKKGEAQPASSGRRHRRGAAQDAARSSAFAAGQEDDAAKGGIVTDPLGDAPFAVTLSVTVYDFRSMEAGAGAKAEEKAEGKTDEKGKEAAR